MLLPSLESGSGDDGPSCSQPTDPQPCPNPNALTLKQTFEVVGTRQKAMVVILLDFEDYNLSKE